MEKENMLNLADYISATSDLKDKVPVFGALTKESFEDLVYGTKNEYYLKAPVLKCTERGKIVFGSLLSKREYDLLSLVNISDIYKLTKKCILKIHRGNIAAFLYKDASSFSDWFNEFMNGELRPHDMRHRTMVLVDVENKKIYRAENDDIIEYDVENDMAANVFKITVNRLICENDEQYKIVLFNDQEIKYDNGFNEVNTKDVMCKVWDAAINGIA